ncbi:MAG TPA: glycosyltransferase, partial [Vicinamibacterales bacterium]|nr:glycosyltransferase [Vicinamibacterales bacterium]
MSRPAVSVAICLFNSSRFIRETLDSVFAQTFTDFEVILVDDGSTDGCADAAARCYPGVRIIRQDHQGLSVARRTSIAAAAADHVAFLDHDDLWLPHKLEVQMDAARSDPEIALLCSDCLYVDERGQSIRTTSEQYGLDGVNLEAHRGYAELLRRGCFVWQSTVVARTDALRAVDAFNPAFPYIADYDTWLRLARRYRMHYTPEVLAQWRVHSAQFTNRCPDVTLADHRALLGRLYQTASIPAPLRAAIGDRLLGQHRESCRMLLRQRRFAAAARALVGMASYPDRLSDYVQARLAQSAFHVPMRLIRYTLHLPVRARRYLRRLRRDGPTHVWIDGSSLGLSQTGHFSLVTGFVRTMLDRPDHVVHLRTTTAGRVAAQQSVADGGRIRFHRLGWRAFRWTDAYHLATGTPAQLLLLIAWGAVAVTAAISGSRTTLAAAAAA